MELPGQSFATDEFLRYNPWLGANSKVKTLFDGEPTIPAETRAGSLPIQVEGLGGEEKCLLKEGGLGRKMALQEEKLGETMVGLRSFANLKHPMNGKVLRE